MGIVTWIIFGLIAGFAAKALLPGKDPGGLVITMVLGIAGAFVGGFIGTQLGFGSISGFDIRSLLMAIGGAIVLLVAYRFVVK